MPTNTSGGTTTSFTNTPQAQTDSYAAGEDSISYFDVMANDLGGNAKVLWSIDDTNLDGTSGTTGTGDGTLDLTIKDAVGVCNYSDLGARMWITSDGRVAYDTSTFNYLAAGQTATDHFTYAIRLANGTLSWTTVTVTVTGVNDGPDIKVAGTDSASAGLMETDGSLSANGTLTVLDPDTTDTVNIAVTGLTVGGTGGAGSLTTADLLAMLSLTGNSNNAADGTPGSLGWHFNSGNQAFDYLAAGQTLVLTYTLTGTDGHGGSDTQQVSVTITGTNDAAVIGDPAVHEVTEDVAVTSGNLTATGTLAISDADTGEAHFSTTVTGDPANLGSLTLAADGSYSYSVANAAVQFLAGSDANGGTSSHVDTFTVTAADGTTKQVSFTIHGANDAAVIGDVGVTDLAVTEAGGDHNATAGDPDASGTLSVADTDTGENHFVAVPPSSLNGTYGTFTFSDVTGAWTYTLDNDRPATQVLNQGDPVTDTLTVHSADGTAHDIVVNITGANDAAVITEAAVADRQLVEAGGIANGDAGDSTAGGTLGVSDVDDGESHFLAAASADLNGTYGTFSFDASSGAWTYTLDNDRPATQALNAGAPATDTLVVHSADGTPHTITVNIIGANDAAVISEAGGADHDLTEAGGIANAEAGDATAGGTLSVTDVDDGENHFVAPATGSLDGTYGTFTFNESTGAWSYTLDNGRPATQAVVQDQHVTDTLTVHSADGTPHDIIVNITGTNDVAIITQAAGADESLVEAGGVNNGMPGNSTAGGTLSVSDVDAGQSYFVAAADLNGTYGTFTFNQATGAWTYTLDNDRGATQALNGGDPAQDTLTVHSADGTAHDIVVNITGANDAAVITEAAGADHDLVEAGGIGNADAADSSASGTLSVSDVDDGESSFQSAAPGDLAGTYGTFAFNEATGAWTYTLDNDRPATQALNDGAPATDTLTVRSADGTTHDIIVNITGANDAAVITEGAGGDHNLIEAGGIANADAGDSAASGTLSVSDVDAGQGSFVAAPAADLQGTYGTFTFDESTGAWTYTLDNDSTATQALVQDEHATDTLTVHSADGTAHDVVVNITGANDAAVITETAGDDHAVTEAGGTANGTAGDPDAAGTLHVTDVDAGQSSFQAAGDLEGTYGTFTFDETSGAWTYTLDNERAATQALNLGDPAQDSLMVHSADGTAYTVTVDITGSNDAPVVTAALTSLADEGDTSYNLDLLHGASDVDDGETATLSVTDVMYSVDGGPASVTAPAGVSLSGSSLTVDPTNGAFDHLGEGQHATITVTYDVTDAHGATVPQGETITITGTNDAPVVSAGGTLSYTENDAAAAIDAGLTITDVDSAMLSGATVSITGGFATGEDVLGFVAQNGISGSYNAATGVLTLTGPASVADYEAALQSVTYANSSDNPSGATRTISFQVDDGATLDHASNIATASVNVTPVNDAPTSSAVSLTAIAEDSGARLITQAELLANAADVDGPPLSATDLHVASGSGTLVDNHDGTWSYTPSLNDDTSVSFSYTVTDGSLTASGSASLDITPVNDAPVASPVTLTAIAEDSGAHIITQADLLAGVTDVDNTSAELTVTALSIGSGSGSLVDNGNGTWTYTPAADDDGSVSFSYTVSDGQLTASSTATLDITPVNDAPVATVTQATYGATEQVTLHLHGTGLSITDVDAGAGSLTVTLAVTEGVINIFAGTTGAGVSNSGTSSVTITGTLTQINDLLAGNGGATVNYFDGSDTPAASATLSLTVHDNGNTGGGDLSSSATATINITPVNDAPVATIAHTYGVIEQHNLTIHGTGLSISDVDAGSGSMTVTLSVTEGVLNVAAGTSGALVSNSGSSAVTITGSQSQINDLLAGGHSATVVYNDNLDNPSSSVTLTLAAHDNGNTGGGDLSSSATTTITVAPVNDAPVATPVTLTAIAEDSGARTITQAELLAGASDVDNAATDLSITALSITSGSGTLIDNGNHTWTYTPALNDDTGVTFNYTVSDGSLIGTSTASLDITPVNDAAVITGATSGSVTEDAVPNTVTGDLNSTDVDGTADSWTVVSSPTASASGYGTYTIDATGHWTYALDNSNTTVNALNNGATLSDSFTVTTADGTSQVVSVTINGHTDATDVLPPTDIVFGLAASTGTLTGNGINSGMTLGSLTAVDADSTTWTFAIGSVTGQTLPAISLSPATGASVNLVTSGSISSGKYAFSVTATDPAGHSYTETYTLSVGQQQGDGSSAFTITNGTSATNGTDISLGLNGGDTILGGGGDDALVGGNGDDFIHGGLGNDQLIGGQGNDQFFFDTALGTANVDTIFDFNAGGSASNQAVDTVQLDHTIFSALSTGALQAGVSFVSNNTGAASGTHAQIIFNSSTGDLSYDSDGTGAQGAVLFAHLTLTGLTGTLDASDFNVI